MNIGCKRGVLLAAMLVACLAPTAGAAINIDGVPDEPEWQQAQVFTDFRQVEPLTRTTMPYATELRVLALPEGLYLSMRLEHPRNERTHGRSPRDSASLAADPAVVMIDFEGLGNTAYEFSVSLSDTQRDSIVLKQSQISRDWDASWLAKVHENDAGWTVEWEIPWSTAPEGVVHDGKRTIGIYAARYVKKYSQRYAFPAIEQLGPSYVRSFRRIEIPSYRAASLDVFPYASMGYDRLDTESRVRGGLDVAWRPDGRQQFIGALLPDFGQVESDNLVVNFSAIETFFEEKRPFFTEGQQLFDLRVTPQNGRLVNTRRIGAGPDAGGGGISNVLFAGKYTATHERQEYGAFVAVEDDSALADGRRYAVTRYHYKADQSSLGWLATYADRPTLARHALVQTIDYDWQFRPNWSLNAQALMSDVRQEANNANQQRSIAQRGYGAWGTIDYRTGERWQHQLALTWMDKNLNFNDLGFQRRADIRQAVLDTRRFVRKYSPEFWASSGSTHVNLDWSRNSRGETLPATLELGQNWMLRRGGFINASYIRQFTGRDDLISRGNGSVRLPALHFWAAEYMTPQAGKFRWKVAARLEEQGLSGWTRTLEFDPTFFVNESLSVGLEASYTKSDDWLLWRGDTRFARYRYDEISALANLNWFPRPKHEVRLKVQWLGLAARAKQSLRLGADQRLTAADTAADDFTLSSFGLQLRYRYELQPLSDLFVVYSRGGDGSLDDRYEGLGRQFRRSLDQRTADQLFIKLRYRFH